ncbi:glutathione S-transferase theta-2-like isoform X2 [Callorhinus ursinus]|uniref:glutathione S-transferase theta-2-like isoform X2 n=1 Tax=Callorhinus ursinus TaxID=34884 RepID=UPI003CD002F6
MARMLQQLEDKFLEDRAFLTGQQVSLADLMALEELLQETHSPILNILEQMVNKQIPKPPPEVHPFMLLRISNIP